MSHDEMMQRQRELLKDRIRQAVDFSQTAQQRGIPAPAAQKPAPESEERRALMAWNALPAGMGGQTVRAAIQGRRSRRSLADAPVSWAELSCLLWVTQGVQRKFGHGATFRTVPSAGARHALETYVVALRVEGLVPGVYRYLPLSHELIKVRETADLPVRMAEATLGQDFVQTAGAVFVWTAVPARMEWRYDLAAHKVILLDAGHVCQNLYLAAEGCDLGVCAIAAYDQDRLDALTGADGVDEFAIYLASVGKRH